MCIFLIFAVTNSAINWKSFLKKKTRLHVDFIKEKCSAENIWTEQSGWKRCRYSNLNSSQTVITRNDDIKCSVWVWVPNNLDKNIYVACADQPFYKILFSFKHIRVIITAYKGLIVACRDLWSACSENFFFMPGSQAGRRVCFLKGFTLTHIRTFKSHIPHRSLLNNI